MAGRGFRPVDPLPGAAPYFGGKKSLASRIIARIEKIPHLCYAEPFVGMGGIFFRRRFAPAVEVINDRSKNVATFFRILQRHYQAFLDMMKWQVTTRLEFERLARTEPETLTDLERSARFFYLQRTSFSAKLINPSFPARSIRRIDISRLAVQLEDFHTRLSGVVIECLPYDEMIRRYDRATTLFYLDPPYHGREREYEGGFTPDDFGKLAATLAELKGRFIMSLNDDAFVRKCFAGFNLETIEAQYTFRTTSGHAKKVRELLITAR